MFAWIKSHRKEAGILAVAGAVLFYLVSIIGTAGGAYAVGHYNGRASASRELAEGIQKAFMQNPFGNAMVK